MWASPANGRWTRRGYWCRYAAYHLGRGEPGPQAPNDVLRAMYCAAHRSCEREQKGQLYRAAIRTGHWSFPHESPACPHALPLASCLIEKTDSRPIPWERNEIMDWDDYHQRYHDFLEAMNQSELVANVAVEILSDFPKSLPENWKKCLNRVSEDTADARANAPMWHLSKLPLETPGLRLLEWVHKKSRSRSPRFVRGSPLNLAVELALGRFLTRPSLTESLSTLFVRLCRGSFATIGHGIRSHKCFPG